MIGPLAGQLAPLTLRRRRAAGPFDPSSVAGLKLWLRADSLALADGDPVAAWADSSSAGNNAGAAGAARPAFKAGVVNGLPVVRFDGASNTMTLPFSGTSLGAVWGGNAYGLFFVVRLAVGSTANGLIGSSGLGSPTTFLRVDVGPVKVYGNISGAYSSYANTDLSTSFFQARTFRDDATNGVRFATNGAADGTSPHLTYSSGGVVDATLYLGSWPGFGGGLKHDLAEVLVYDTPLSDADAASVETFLMTKYGL